MGRVFVIILLYPHVFALAGRKDSEHDSHCLSCFHVIDLSRRPIKSKTRRHDKKKAKLRHFSLKIWFRRAKSRKHADCRVFDRSLFCACKWHGTTQLPYNYSFCTIFTSHKNMQYSVNCQSDMKYTIPYLIMKMKKIKAWNAKKSGYLKLFNYVGRGDITVSDLEVF